MNYIPQIEPWINEDEMEQLTEVIQTTFITENRKTEEFLDRIRAYTGASYAIAMSNGTIALVASLMCENIGLGDEVIVPNLTFIATANAVRLVGATPVFCDVQVETGCINPEMCRSLITPRTSAIIPVHLYGQAADMSAILEIAKQYNLCVIEDAAESFGVKLDGKHTGTFGDYGIFSFFANKIITCGEGGVVLTNSEKRYNALYKIKNHGRARKGIFIHEQIGYNFCFTDLQAAIGVAQIKKINTILAAKRANFEYYSKHLNKIKGLQVVKIPENVQSNYWFVNILVNEPDKLVEHLHQAGIGVRRYFYPLHRQPCYSDVQSTDSNFPVSDWLYSQGISLPSGPQLNEEQLKVICQAVRAFFRD